MLFLCILLIILFLFETFIVILSFLFNNIPAFLLRDARHAMHDMLLLIISASLHSVSLGAKPLSTGQWFCALPEAISDERLTLPLILIKSYSAASSRIASIAVLISSIVLKLEKLKRTTPCSVVPRVSCMSGAQCAPALVAIP